MRKYHGVTYVCSTVAAEDQRVYNTDGFNLSRKIPNKGALALGKGASFISSSLPTFLLLIKRISVKGETLNILQFCWFLLWHLTTFLNLLFFFKVSFYLLPFSLAHASVSSLCVFFFFVLYWEGLPPTPLIRIGNHGQQSSQCVSLCTGAAIESTVNPPVKKTIFFFCSFIVNFISNHEHKQDVHHMS